MRLPPVYHGFCQGPCAFCNGLVSALLPCGPLVTIVTVAIDTTAWRDSGPVCGTWHGSF